jgi:hypothetical protein
MTGYEEFMEWLKKGPQRAPHLYSGKVVHPPVSEPRRAVQGSQEAHKAAPVDRKKAAAGEADDGNWWEADGE